MPRDPVTGEVGKAGAMETLLHYSDVAHHYATLKSNLIQEMPFETELIKTLGFSLSQLRFAIALFLSVPVSVGVRLFSSPTGGFRACRSAPGRAGGRASS